METLQISNIFVISTQSDFNQWKFLFDLSIKHLTWLMKMTFIRNKFHQYFFFAANFVSLLLGSPSRGPQMEALPPLDPASQQLCWAGLTCLAHFLCWVPLSTVVRPQLLSTIFHFAAFGSQKRPDYNDSSPTSRSSAFSSSTHKLGRCQYFFFCFQLNIVVYIC